ncbi:P-loop containing nucleoside triphosphate hydrolase protein [Zopfia rhizophila CBS 207.26]|uniref:P-loop containing nucleoside triphosphate hydrolase protein n=1 Tax=Zopfia rhizophila CBS 207.26 TaxID=1314779 RepID=A0A6A6ESQ3_9PEZI|nr:P-loop containing nucleoside triphosphate hydrolase protein [Zopfia rhizophila CBS 207.26]
MLFPEESDGNLQTKLNTVPYQRGLFDPVMNFEQLKAVDSVAQNEYGLLPFLISGPPGTGKTKTIVEIALQLLQTTKTAHILICAPSDPAADTLALRLRKHLNPKQLLRLNGPGRTMAEVPGALMPYCYIDRDMFYLPPMPQFMKYNIVVTSVQDTSILVDARLTNSDLHIIEKKMLSAFRPEDPLAPSPLHWGALLMDEAAQGTELEALLPLTVILPPSMYPATSPQPQFVLAGDQNQLGPRTASHTKEFAISLFERLISRKIYTDHPLSRSKLKPSASPPVLTSAMLPILYPPFVNLIRNYRSHPSILSVPSTLFYSDTLIPEAHFPSSPLQSFSLWRGRRWPVLFLSNNGNDEIERDGGGWYNLSEARMACNLAQKLVTEAGVLQHKISIMSPFAAQVKMLRELIRSNIYGLWEINIGPLEAFQGLENRVVIICTTRTRERFLVQDQSRNLGLIGQDKKMNVAITRAKEALFVIGSPQVLEQDPCWKEFLAFCCRNRLVDDAMDKVILKRLGKTGKVGVLEKALICKEERRTEVETKGRMLGGGQEINDDEMWTAGLQAALENFGDEHDEEGYVDEYCEENYDNDL